MTPIKRTGERRPRPADMATLCNDVIKMEDLAPVVVTRRLPGDTEQMDGYMNNLHEALTAQDAAEVLRHLQEARSRLGAVAVSEELASRQVLHSATWSAPDKVLEALLEEEECSALLEQRDERGRTPLMVAASRGRLGCVLALLKHGADWRAVDPERGHTVLHKAALSGRDTVLAVLLARGATELLETRDKHSLTPLMAAVARGHLKCAQVLEEVGARVDARCNRRQTVVHSAAVQGNSCLLKELLDYPAVYTMYDSVLCAKDGDGFTSLMLAVMAGSTSCVRILLQTGSHKHELYEELKYNPLYLAASRGYSRIVQLLLMSCECRTLNLPADIDKRLTLEYARNGTIFLEDVIILHGVKGCDMVNNILRDKGCEPRQNSTLPEYSRIITKYKTTCLHLAAESGCVKTLETFYSCFTQIKTNSANLQSKDIDRRNAFNQTPLHVAAISGSRECTTFLIKHGANLAASVEPSSCFSDGADTSAVRYVLRHTPEGADILTEVLDECVEVKCQVLGHQDITLDFRILCPSGEKRMTVLQEMYRHREKKMYPLLKHTVVQVLIYVEWHKLKYSVLIAIHFIAYITYIATLASYMLLELSDVVHIIMRSILLVLCLVALISSSPFLFLAGGTKTDRLFRFMTKLSPPILTLFALILDYKPLSCFALLFSWLALIHFTNMTTVISYQFAMFQYIMKKLVDHIVVFIYILAGFSFTFYLMYQPDQTGSFRTLWESVLSTTVILLQGDLTGTPQFKPEKDSKISPDMLIAGGIMQQLFVVTVVLALLNMWVGLAVKGGRELERQGHIHYYRNQVRVLVVLEKLYEILNAGTETRTDAERNHVTIQEGDVPVELYCALRCNANSRRKSGPDLGQTLARLTQQVDRLERRVLDLKYSPLKGVTKSKTGRV